MIQTLIDKWQTEKTRLDALKNCVIVMSEEDSNELNVLTEKTNLIDTFINDLKNL